MSAEPPWVHGPDDPAPEHCADCAEDACACGCLDCRLARQLADEAADCPEFDQDAHDEAAR